MNPFDEPDNTFLVLIDDEDQYSPVGAATRVLTMAYRDPSVDPT